MPNTTVMAPCHPTRLHHARGLCKKCYYALPEWQDRARGYQKKYREKDPAEYRAANAAYAREWRSRPENIDRARASSRAGYVKAKERDPDGFRESARQRRIRWEIANPDYRERKNEQARRRSSEGRTRRHGLTRIERDRYIADTGAACQVCGSRNPGGRWWHMDHDHGHCAKSQGCIECLRGYLCARCNLEQGVIESAVAGGRLSGFTGAWGRYLDNPPFQRYRRASAT